MKLTLKKIKQLIKEELEKINEADYFTPAEEQGYEFRSCDDPELNIDIPYKRYDEMSKIELLKLMCCATHPKQYYFAQAALEDMGYDGPMPTLKPRYCTDKAQK